MTKSKGLGRGGKRHGAGRKPNAPPIPAEDNFDDASAEAIMERGMRIYAAQGLWGEASKIAARLEAARARKTQAARARPGKKQSAAADAASAGQNSDWGDDLMGPTGRPN